MQLHGNFILWYNDKQSVSPGCTTKFGLVGLYTHVLTFVYHMLQKHYERSIQLFHACSGNNQNYWPEVVEMTWELLPEAEGRRQQLSPATRDNSFDYSLNRHEITVLLSYIHAYNHKSTEDDNVSISYHYKIGAQHCFERNTTFDRNDALHIVLGHGTVWIRK